MKEYSITEQEYYELDLYMINNMIQMSNMTREENELIWEVERFLGEVY